MKPVWFLLFLCLLLFFSRLSQAHEPIIRPVLIELKADPSKIRISVKTHVGYWLDWVFEVNKIPARRWPDDLKKKARDYLNSHFFLFIDGKPLLPDWIDERYIENPWNAKSGGTIVYQGVCSLPSSSDTGPSPVLSGRSIFFFESLEEYRQDRTPKEVARKERDFRTELSIPGQVRRRFILTPESPAFQISLQDTLRTPRQVMEEHFVWGIHQFFINFSLPLFVMAAVLCWVLQ